MSQQGDHGSIDFQVAAVNEALESVSEFVDARHKAVFDGTQSYLENQHGKRTRLRRQNEMWYLDCREIPHEIASSPNKSSQFFQRQG